MLRRGTRTVAPVGKTRKRGMFSQLLILEKAVAVMRRRRWCVSWSGYYVKSVSVGRFCMLYIHCFQSSKIALGAMDAPNCFHIFPGKKTQWCVWFPGAPAVSAFALAQSKLIVSWFPPPTPFFPVCHWGNAEQVQQICTINHVALSGRMFLWFSLSFFSSFFEPDIWANNVNASLQLIK